jgi:hypothetical protein
VVYEEVDRFPLRSRNSAAESPSAARRSVNPRSRVSATSPSYGLVPDPLPQPKLLRVGLRHRKALRRRRVVEPLAEAGALAAPLARLSLRGLTTVEKMSYSVDS